MAINNTWPYFAEDEILAVEQVLKRGRVNYWTGDECKLFEKEFAAFIGTDYAISLSNGTVSLELALRACNISEGDEVITTPRTFIASASAIVAVGATPVLADVDPYTGNITAENILTKITKKTRAIIPVHLAGYPCEMDKIMQLATEYKLYVVEDCAQAHGAEYKGKKVGAWGHFGSFSFCQDKIMTTGGEGGMLVCYDPELYKKAWSYKDHGKGYDAVFHTKHEYGFRWLHDSFGTNMRMTEMQATIGRKQLEKLPTWLKRRNKIARCYSEVFKDLPIVDVPTVEAGVYHAFYKYYLLLNETHVRSDWSRDRIIIEINKLGVACFSGSCSEIYKEKAFLTSEYAVSEPLYETKRIGNRSLMLLCHPTLSNDDINHIASTVAQVLKMASI
ncbi:DegT/DnrJ/EryC1/StrS family aminotransferase [Fastidiosibacter lacustris]|uniref:DegT/DnrJ/EryC1/StrS family aminotransferase n=1 Tax=Fastidiosibacter lacustris TaxID=2056695 RepID=UPI000E34429E|nr:DegT/DnrJ/EryC1/StrS aminotransferase family protein [Fastidiosibacter lacustris]